MDKLDSENDLSEGYASGTIWEIVNGYSNLERTEVRDMKHLS